MLKLESGGATYNRVRLINGERRYFYPGSTTTLSGIFLTSFVQRPTVNWELVAWHEENMDAVNGIFGL